MCAVCGHRKYHRVVIERQGRKPYVTDFYRCGGCTTMFLSPEAFTASKHNPLDTLPDVSLGWTDRLARNAAKNGDKDV